MPKARGFTLATWWKGFHRSQMRTLRCTREDGTVNDFFYEQVAPDPLDEPGIERFRVHRAPRLASEDYWFELSLKPLRDGSMLIDMIEANRPHYRGMGIPEALLPEVARSLGKVIVSSSDKSAYREYDNEKRSGDAERMWRRLQAKGLAKYRPADGRFELSA
jgi:hypothetical protein